MKRKTAVAAASAISISLVAATVALGANLGALGFASSSPAPMRPRAAIIATNQTTTSSNDAGYQEHGEHEDEHEGHGSDE